MHLATMGAICFLVASKAEMAITIGLLSGWFGFMSGDKLHGKNPTAALKPDSLVGKTLPISSPISVTKETR